MECARVLRGGDVEYREWGGVKRVRNTNHLLLLAFAVLTKAKSQVAHSLHTCLYAHGFIVVKAVILP